MKKMEQLELDAHRKDIINDMHSLLEKYRTIFGWDIPITLQLVADCCRKVMENACFPMMPNVVRLS
jgi:hypothetical protein